MSLKENKIYTVVFTFVAPFIFILILSLINGITKENAEKNEKLYRVSSILNAFNIKTTGNEDALLKFDKYIKEEINEEYTLLVSSYRKRKSYGLIITGNGLWGAILSVVTFNSDLSRIKGIDFIDLNETPGLGARITEDWFRVQFNNELIQNNEIKLNPAGSPQGDKNKENSSFDGVTGATRTSEGVRDLVNNSIKIIKNIR